MSLETAETLKFRSVLMVAVEHYLTICRPFSQPVVHPARSCLPAGSSYISFTVVFSLLYNANKWLELKTVWHEDGAGVWVARLGITPLRLSPLYQTVQIAANTLVMGQS